MKKLWNFGGTYTDFGKKLSHGFDVNQFGRHNVDYSDIDGFIKKVEQNTDLFPIPDIISFNMNPDTHYYNFEQRITPKEDFDKLINLINTNFFFQVRLVEWFFSKNKNKRVLFLTSNQSNSIVQPEDELDSEIFQDGDLLLYRMNRALEHQLIHAKNLVQENHINDNIIMGVCVGYNVSGTPEYLNGIMKTDSFKRNVFGIGEHTINGGNANIPTLSESNLPTIDKINSILLDII